MSAKKFQLQRTPVVVVMGHVDHGKTTLLDKIRGTAVQASEVGGITQNTRAHQIAHNGHTITFIDTPGHEAFSSMRSRGARVTDIVLLVVAVDDGVQPQTKESINFAKEHNVPIIVAFNKIDLPGKDSTKLKKELSNAGVQLEEYGGDVMAVEVSALKGTGINELLDTILLVAEMSELKSDAPQNVKARLFVLESTLDKTRGPVALCIVKAGTVETGDYVVSAANSVKIRSLLDSEQKLLTKAMQSDPIWIIGLDEVHKAGTYLDIVASDKEAEALLKKYAQSQSQTTAIIAEEGGEVSDLDLLASLLNTDQKEEEIKYINIILKTDMDGTLEAVKDQLLSLNDESVQVKIIREGTGNITEDDVLTAKDVKGIVIGFQVLVDAHVQSVAKKERVLVRTYDIIYTLIDEIADVMDGMLEPTEEEVEIARATVKKAFQLSNGQYIAGSVVDKGTFIKGVRVYVERAGERVHQGKITSLRVLKDEVKEVKKGSECGILIEPNATILEDDQIVSFKIEKF